METRFLFIPLIINSKYDHLLHCLSKQILALCCFMMQNSPQQGKFIANVEYRAAREACSRLPPVIAYNEFNLFTN